MITVTTKLQVQRERAGRKRLAKGKAVAEIPVGDQVPRISRLMALAIKFQGMLRDGVVRDQSELARLARVTQPRMTQILSLSFLAPEIQEEILFMDGDAAVSEKSLRPITVEPSWERQQQSWRELNKREDGGTLRANASL